jgi:hypothetical protein
MWLLPPKTSVRAPRLSLYGVAVLLLGMPAVAVADGIYRYEEKDGTIVYTNVAPGPGKRARRMAGTFKRAPAATDPVPEARPYSRGQYDDLMEAAALRYRIPVALVRAVVHAESNFDPTAVSPKGASGLMQLMPETAREMFVKDIFEPRDNIEGGTRYLRVLANLYGGDMVKMVAAYNAGPEAVNRNGGIPPYEETQAYVRKVIALYFRYKEQGTLKAERPAQEQPDEDQAAAGADRDEAGPAPGPAR